MFDIQLFSINTGFVFLLFAREESVHRLLDACDMDDKDFYFYLSSASVKKKKVSQCVHVQRYSGFMISGPD